MIVDKILEKYTSDLNSILLVWKERQCRGQNLDLSRYFDALERFKLEHPEEVIKYWKSEKAFDNMIK